MGLFSKKDPCAICGGKVKALLPWKVDGHLICNDCYKLVDLPIDDVNRMSIDEFRAYLAFREENAQLRQTFQVTEQIDFGWLDDKFLFDMNNGFMCMDKNLEKTIFEAGQIRSFVIREDSTPLFEGSAAGLVIYPSSVPDRALAMAPQIQHFRMQEQMRRNAERWGDRDGDSRPSFFFDIPEPFQNFNVEIFFNHPYWRSFTADMKGPTFNNTFPDVNDYLREYNENAAVMERLARAIMDLAFSNAPEQVAGAAGYTAVPVQPAAAPAATPDAVTEIQRFKTLMDQGIITEEEFTAKKRQLLGI